jgi:hypothetical protein
MKADTRLVFDSRGVLSLNVRDMCIVVESIEDGACVRWRLVGVPTRRARAGVAGVTRAPPPDRWEWAERLPEPGFRRGINIPPITIATG